MLFNTIGRLFVLLFCSLRYEISLPDHRDTHINRAFNQGSSAANGDLTICYAVWLQWWS